MEMVFSGGGKVGKGKRVGGSRAGAGGDGGGGRGYKVGLDPFRDNMAVLP